MRGFGAEVDRVICPSTVTRSNGRKMCGKLPGAKHYLVATARAGLEPMENQRAYLRPCHRVFGHPMLRVIIKAGGTRLFHQIAALLSSYFYEDNSRLKGLQ